MDKAYSVIDSTYIKGLYRCREVLKNGTPTYDDDRELLEEMSKEGYSFTGNVGCHENIYLFVKLLSAEEIYQQYHDLRVKYKSVSSGFIAGWHEHYVILGFKDTTGCIQSFRNDVSVKSRHEARGIDQHEFFYLSYRFAKPGNIEIMS